jgi:Ca2+/H+ antiporter
MFIYSKRHVYVVYVLIKFIFNRLLAITAVVGVCSEFLVSAIEEVTKIWHISETFVGRVFHSYYSRVNSNVYYDM